MTLQLPSRFRAGVAACVAAFTACDLGPSDLASFIDGPFGDVTAEVTTLEGPRLDGAMHALMLRFRHYLALRDAIPFSELAPEACVRDVQQGANTFAFTADVACTFGDAVSPAAGTVALRQELVAEDPDVIELDVEYRGVELGALTVDGDEHIVETDAPDGASVRTLSLVQDGVAFDHTFRLGLSEGDTPVFDYTLSVDGEGIVARVTGPQRAGGFVTVFLFGIDGVLECEVRDTAWSSDEAARGVCDNGAAFGLPR